jgi:hypothetical protein
LLSTALVFSQACIELGVGGSLALSGFVFQLLGPAELGHPGALEATLLREGVIAHQ